MENMYNLVSDNINEIICISFDIKISYNISVVCKPFSNYFYDVSKLTIEHSYPYLPLIRFNKIKELSFGVENKYFDSDVYKSQIEKLTRLEHLQLNASVSGKLNLNECRKLSSLFVIRSRQISCIYSSVKNLTCVYDLSPPCPPKEIYSKQFIVLKCTNLQNLNIKLIEYENLFLEHIHKQLTGLALDINCHIPFYYPIHSNYFNRLVELSVNGYCIDFSKYIYPELTKLVAMNINNHLHLHFHLHLHLSRMPKLKYLHITAKNSDKPFQAIICHTHKLEHLIIDKFDGVILGKYVSNMIECQSEIIFPDNLKNLESMKITNRKKYSADNDVFCGTKLKFAQFN